ncbi:splicing factor U2af large subunit A-like isoform X1 [Cucurbita moschata]|uniref:Splicing factor U2af large subunit A-like isoform X1 n=2 Tax=Cucurbita moschata TaxID=3662 RepID=A0A6J1EP79_CUCMO|nr:splicing factor U2af large subunit A-like isoform X1 [Cucurbita moschata]
MGGTKVMGKMQTTMAMVFLLKLVVAAMVATTLTVIRNLSMVLENMKGNLQKVEKKKEIRGGIGRRTGRGIGTEVEKGIGRKARMGKETGRKTGKGIVTRTVIGIVTVIIETAIGIEVRGGKGAEVEMMMITTGVETTTGGETMIKNEKTDIDVGLVLAQREYLNIGQGPLLRRGQDHAPKANELVVLTWLLPLLQYYLVQLLLQCGKLTTNCMVSLAGQIPGTTPAIPGMFPTMFPLATGQPFGALPVMPVQAMTQQATRHARRVYVGGLPPTANEQSVATFFSQVMAAIGGNTAGPGDAVVNVYINHEKKFAFVEMRSVEEASNAMALDGIIFEGAPVKVRRPSDYNPSLAATLGPSQPSPNLNLAAVGLTPGSAGGLEGPDRIFVGGLPYYFTEAQVRELLESFGPLRGFDLVKDRETGNSKGYAFCVYQDLSVTDIACAALNGIKMGDKTLTVRRANQGTNQPKPEQESVLLHAQQQIALQKLMLQPGAVSTKVLCLTQVVTPEELINDEDYEDIMEDMRGEGGKFGALVNVVIPRPRPNEAAPGVGKVFLEYADIESATKARSGLNGRKFGGNQVIAVFYPENKFAQGEYDA